MLRCFFQAVALSAAVVIVSCGGVSAEKFSALQAEVQKIQSAQSEGTDPKLAALDDRVTKADSQVTERFKKMEDMLEVLQRQVSKSAAEEGKKATPAAGNDAWADVDKALGIEEDGVAETEEGKRTVKRSWLVRQVRALALSSKVPKLAEGKKGGVSIKGVKPTSLAGRLGLKNNDVIRAIGDREVNSVAELSVALRAVHSPVTVKIQRRKKELELQYTLTD